MAVELQETSRINALFERISALIEQARKRVVTAANIAEVYTKYNIGHYIVEEEQQGKSRAEYGQFVLKKLSEKLSERYGKGWGTENLRLIRSFYLVYSHKIQNSVLEIGKENQNVVLEFNTSENEQNTNWNNTVATIQSPCFTLSWSHYLVLMRIENPDARGFYEIECTQQQWSVWN